jgi:hypothetical protein
MAEFEENEGRHLTANADYVTSSALKIRLDTNPILSQIELFLRGSQYIVVQDQYGRIKQQNMKTGQPKANQLGIQSILNYVTGVFNPQVVQGNFKEEMYQNYIMELNIDLATMIVNNCYTWEVREDDIDVICDFIMSMLQPFISRLIDNKERESYEKSLITHETSRTEERNKGFFLNPFKRGN